MRISDITWAVSFIALTVSVVDSHADSVYRYRVKDSHPIADSWSRLEQASRSTRINLQIGLKQDRFQELGKCLYEVSDPGHHRYGQHLSAVEVNDLVRPSDETLSLVKEWLQSYDIREESLVYSPARDWISIQLNIQEVEALLQTEYLVFESDEGKKVIRAQSFSLPEHLHDHIDLVHPTTSFFSVEGVPGNKELRVNSSKVLPEKTSLSARSKKIPKHEDGALPVETICNASAITPLCLRTLYGTIDYKHQSPENTMGLANYLGEFNNQSDINTFLEAYRPDAAQAGAAYNFTIHEVAGGKNQQSPATLEQLNEKYGKEGNLDAEVMLGIGFPTRLVTYSTGGDAPPFETDGFRTENTNEPYLTWLQYVLSQPDPPRVISTSYGDIEHTVPYAYAKRVCDSFAQLGARGVTIIFGAGDWGVGKNGTCLSNDGTSRSQFLASFPDSCPYGTSVGATRGVDPEIVAYNDDNGFASGGGFSNYFPRPEWQDKAVKSYFETLGDEHKGMFNKSGRGYPDIAAQGYRIATVWNGNMEIVDGTSASAPIMAAIVALVNDALLAQDKPPLGFLNPWLYTKGFEAFTDVITGSTKGCDTRGFPAEKGWDPASGFGTPWFPKLTELALKKTMEQPTLGNDTLHELSQDQNHQGKAPWYYG